MGYSPGSGILSPGSTEPDVALPGIVATLAKIVWESATFIQAPPDQSPDQSSRNASWRSPSSTAPSTSAIARGSNCEFWNQPFTTLPSGTVVVADDLNLRSSRIAKLIPP